MPLTKSASKKAFKHNIEVEMKSGKPQDQALAIAYSIKRKNRKKMAEGGEISAKDEKRPMPENEYDDKHEISLNKSRHSMEGDGWSDKPNASDKFEIRQKLTSGDPDESSPHTGESEEDMLRRHAMERAAYAKGGHVMREEDEDGHLSIAEQVMKRRKKMADGGEVDLDHNSMEEPNQYYHQNEDYALKENYDEDMTGVHQPEDSNERGRELADEDEESRDMIKEIQKRMRSKRSR